jgi:site-specific DNA recombinase
MTLREAIIYLRLSDFREDDDGDTWVQREAELRALADELHLHVLRVAIENDRDGDGKAKGASAYKTPIKVQTSTGLIEFRTDRPEFQSVALDLQRGKASVLIVSDASRIARNEYDGLNLINACQVSRASVVCPDDDGAARWILTNGGTPTEIDNFKDRIADARRFSADIAAKVRKGRRRWAGKSYGGGRPGYGFEVVDGTEEHKRNLAIVEREAAELRWAADLLLRGVSLKWCAQDLRERAVPTRTGAKWSAGSLRDALLKPSVAGLIGDGRGRGNLVEAPWPHIIEPETWYRLRDHLTDPSRRTNAGRSNAPKWLVSVFATCGVCGKPLRVGGAGRGRGPAYVGAECGHVRRDAAKVDHVVTEAVLYLLERPEVLDRLRPPARPGVDVAGLRAELRKLDDRRRQYEAMAADFDAREMAGILAGIKRRERAIGEELATSAAAPDPLAEFRAAPARVAWEALPAPRRRAVVQALLAEVVILPAGRGNRFDPTRVQMREREGLRAP